MSVDWVNLDDDEEVLWQGQPRIKSILPAVIVGIPLIPFLIGIAIIVGAYYSVKNTYFVVTDQGLYRKSGVLSRNVQKIGFDKVQNISFSQGVLGSYFDYGNIEISTAGGQGVEMRFNSIDNPREVEQIINRHLKKEKGQSTGKKETGSDEQLQELKEIRKLLQSIDSKLE
ncbi:PH domain-containing protein [Candidatus Nanohaloarchaea archaeon]|nr:PH domain-containing protein [Candidatus Nanohaloarchaea archaeon]